MLSFYGQHFRSVEINGTFFKRPTPEVLASWARDVPPDFKFVLKAPRFITHMRRLNNVDESVKEFIKLAKVLRKRLGAILLQTPPNFAKDVVRLRNTLSIIPRSQRVAFEFRHQSWFDDEIFDLLRQNRAALCLAEADADLDIPFVATADWGYLRLRMANYSDAELKAWAKRLKRQKWGDAFVFFKHEDEGKGPAFAKRFIDLMK